MALNGAYENKKTRRLARALQMPPWAALGLMEAVWHWTRKSARTGRIEPDQWEDLADYLQWQKPAEALREMLRLAGLVDPMDGWDYVHDWHQHADDLLRKTLEYHKEKFANGEETRNWRKLPSQRSTKKVHEEREKVRENPENFEPSHARAWPEPEPEPEPEPAAAATPARDARAKPASPPPPPPADAGNANGYPEFEAYRSALQGFMAKGTPPPDDALVMRVVFAARGAPVDALIARFRQFAKTRHEPPKSYGFWPEVVSGWFDTPKPNKSRGAKA